MERMHVDLVGVEKIAGWPTAFDAVVPLVGSTDIADTVPDIGDTPFDAVAGAAALEDIYVSISPGLGDDLNAYKEQLRASQGSEVFGRTSYLQTPEIWRINALEDVSEDEVRVDMGRAGVPEFRLRKSKHEGSELAVGSTIISYPKFTETVWEDPKDKTSRWAGLKVEFESDGTPPWETQVEIPLLRLHCPRREGCDASFVTEASREEQVETSVNVMGLGGGDGVRFSLRMQHEYQVRDRCMEVVVPATLSLQAGRWLLNVPNSEVLSYGFRATVDTSVEARRTLVDRDIPSEQDKCNQPHEALERWQILRTVDRSGASGDAEGNMMRDTFGVEKSITGKVSVGLTFGGKVPINMSLDYTRVGSHMAEISTGFAPGSGYWGYRPAQGSKELCWTTR